MTFQDRRYPRIASHHSVLVRKLGEVPVEEFAHTRTIAVGGCCVVSEEPLGIGSPLELLIAIEGRVLTVRGRVVYEIAATDGRTETGVEFAEMNAADAAAIESLFERGNSPDALMADSR